MGQHAQSLLRIEPDKILVLREGTEPKLLSLTKKLSATGIQWQEKKTIVFSLGVSLDIFTHLTPCPAVDANTKQTQRILIDFFSLILLYLGIVLSFTCIL